MRSCASAQQITIRDALNSALDEEMARDGDVFILGEEVCPRSDHVALHPRQSPRAIHEKFSAVSHRWESTREPTRCEERTNAMLWQVVAYSST
jgi:hypothetical protein